MLHRRKLLTLAAPALITARDALAQPIPTVLDGFPAAQDPRQFPILYPYGARRWNKSHPLAYGLQFGILLGGGSRMQPNLAYDFVNAIVFYQQNSGTSVVPIPNTSRGSLLRFASASNGHLAPSVANPSANVLAAYSSSMLGAISLVVVGCWPIGASSTGSQQTVMSVGNNDINGYKVPFDFNTANTMGLYRAGNSGADYYVAVDSGAGAGSEYTQSQISTWGVSHSGAFPGGASAVKFYRRGVWTGASTVTHDMSNPPTVSTASNGNPNIGRTGNNSSSYYGYANGFMSVIYGWNRELSGAEFALAEQDKWWALHIPGNPLLAGVGSAVAAITGRPRGIILP